MALVWKKTAPKIWSKVIQSKSKKNLEEGNSTESNAEYRRKFLDGLRFYCESPSLILNSDLPADLVEFVTSQGFPIEALGIILEVKKSGALTADNKAPTESIRFNEITRRLVEEWMTSDSCAEAFVSLSIGEEVPGILAETTNFQRILFTIVDHFHLKGKDFLKFLLQQCFISIGAISHGVRNECESPSYTFRSQPLSTFLDRIFLRFHSEAEHFQQELIENPLEQSGSLFVEFFCSIANAVEQDFIGRRFMTKIFLGLGTTSVTKIAKTLALIGKGAKSAISKLLQPSEDFLMSNPVWKHALLTNIPFRTSTTSTLFWHNWAKYVFSQGNLQIQTEIWSNCVRNWTSLCNNTYIDSNILIPSTYALISLSIEVKMLNNGTESSGNENLNASSDNKISLINVGDILESVTKCLDSTNENKRSCGMAVAQIVAELHFPSKSKEFTKLEFESQSEVFNNLMKFYTGFCETEEIDDTLKNLNLEEKGMEKPAKIKVLDSDDDDEPENEEIEKGGVSVDEECQFKPMDSEEEYPTDERLQGLHLTGKRLPMYFSEIVEYLVGDGKQKDEAEKEALKEVSVLKISVLLGYGVRIDANMANLLTKMLIDMEGGRFLEIPILFGLFEISVLHPFDVYDVLASVTFDKEHHTVGHRMVVLSRYAEVVQLISRQKCFSCYEETLKSLNAEFCALVPEFMKTYYEGRRKTSRRCKKCSEKFGIEFSSIVVVESTSDSEHCAKDNETTVDLTWREIVDRRVAAKTRYFGAKRKKVVLIPDEYSSKLLPIIWASLANRLANKKSFFLQSGLSKKSSGSSLNDMLLAHILRVLGRIVVGTSGPLCPHLRYLSAQVGDLVSTFIQHDDPHVRRSSLALLAVTLTTGEAKPFVIEALCSTQDFFLEKLKSLAEKETDSENKELFTNVLAYITTSTVIGLQLQQ